MKIYLTIKNKRWVVALITIGVIAIVMANIKSYSDNLESSKRNIVFDDLKVIVYQNGKEIVINQKVSYFQELRKEVEDFLTSSNNALYELVTNETISRIKEGKAIEIIYSRPREFKINNPADSRKLIKVDRVLIPLDGYYSPKTVFWGLKSYSSGPFINSGGSDRVERIKEIIRHIGDS